MNVLSLFDGMSCGRIALERAGIPVTSYFASEIDKYAIAVSQNNWTDITHIGDVTKVDSTLVPDIDLLIGGSPCQGFSFAGKQLNFNDPRSALFFEYVRILKDCKPKYFFLENVVMKQEHQDVISEALGVEPIKLNSALVSAQNRKRLYWTNIPYFGIPEDRNILMKDILNPPFAEDIEDKSLCLSARYRNNPSIRDYNRSQKQLIRLKQVGFASDLGSYKSAGRIYSINSKSPTLRTMQGGNMQPKIQIAESINGEFIMNKNYRKLTVVECERLQGLPDGYSSGVSNTQRYKMLGNGWQADTIAHLFKGLNCDETLL